MAGKRHKSPNKTLSKSPEQDKEYLRRLRVLSKAGINVDPTNRRRANEQFRKLISRESLEKQYTVKADAATRKKLKERGFATTKKGVLIDRPRFAGKTLPGSKVRVTKSGDVVMTTKARRDVVVGMTKKEKKEFAIDPAKFIKKKTKELRDKYPTLKRVKKIRARLQWGVFSGTKDFSPYFFQSLTSWEAAKTASKKKKEQYKKDRLDKLTGLHFVIHTTKKTRGKKNAAKKGKSKRRRS